MNLSESWLTAPSIGCIILCHRTSTHLFFGIFAQQISDICSPNFRYFVPNYVSVEGDYNIIKFQYTHHSSDPNPTFHRWNGKQKEKLQNIQNIGGILMGQLGLIPQISNIIQPQSHQKVKYKTAKNDVLICICKKIF